MNRRLKTLAGTGILVTTIAVFTWYLRRHHEILHQLSHTNPFLLVGLVALYVVFSAALVGLSIGSVEFCGKKLSLKENIIVYSYSALVNFFGPLQSGPGMRALYLKKRHGVSLRNYTIASIFYYLFYAFFSGLMLLSGSGHYWWLTLAAALVAILLAMTTLRIIAQRKPVAYALIRAHIPSVVKIGFATLAQMIITAIIYFVELHNLNSHITFWQAVTYAGAANFALFVSLTPGAIGFRESFLFLAQRLHHIDSNTIVGASLIDRTAYIVMLGVLFAVVIGLHAHNRFASVLKAEDNSQQDLS